MFFRNEMWKLIILLPLVCIIIYSVHNTLSYNSENWYNIDNRVEEINSLKSELFSQLTPHLNGYKLKDINDVEPHCLLARHRVKVGEGWQKMVLLDEHDSTSIIKVPNINGPTFQACLENTQAELCKLLVLQSIMNEIHWMVKLGKDPNVIKIRSYCIPKDPIKHIEDVGIKNELGTPLTTLFLVQQSWEYRVRLIKEIVEFVKRHRHLTFNDFRRQQFVVIGNKPILVDLDGISIKTSDIEGKLISQKLINEFVNNFILLDIPQKFLNESSYLKTARPFSITLDQLSTFLRFEDET